MKALKIENLKKIYKGGTEALKGVDFSVEEGDFFALLGPNGAGKSTTINIVSSLATKTSGQVSVFDFDINKNINEAKNCIGLVPQEFNFNIFEKVFDIVTCQAGYYGINKKEACTQAEKYLKKLTLWDKRETKGLELSGGMKRKLMIARALVHKPKLLILDEPTAGVDVETRREMWDLLQELNKNGMTIILTTHYLEEAEQLCKNIAIINEGELITNTSMKSLLSTLDKETFILDIKDSINDWRGIPEYNIKKIDNHTLNLEIVKKQSLNKIFSKLSEQNIEVQSLRNKTNRLEELFIDLTKKI